MDVRKAIMDRRIIHCVLPRDTHRINIKINSLTMSAATNQEAFPMRIPVKRWLIEVLSACAHILGKAIIAVKKK